MALSLEEHIQRVRTAVYRASQRDVYVEYTYTDHVIVNYDDKFYRANYTIDALGAVAIEDPSLWQRVEREWMAAAAKSIRSNSWAVKKVGDYTLRGYGVVFGGKDLYGETFESDTDFGESRSFIGMPVYYDHALGSIRSQIGEVKAYQFADDGIEFEIELDRRKAYADTIMRLADAGALGMSSGSAQHLVVIDNNKIKRWPLLELSLTPTPAEPRTSALPVKNQPPKAAPKASGDDAEQQAGDDDTYIILED